MAIICNFCNFCLKILCFIYSQTYFIEWNDDTRAEFSMKKNIPMKYADEIVEACVNLELFDSRLYAQSKTITSLYIQTEWLKYMRRRTKVFMYTKSILVDLKVIYDLRINGFILLNEDGQEVEVVKKQLKNQSKLTIKPVRPENKRLVKRDKRYIKSFVKVKWEDRDEAFKNEYPKNIYESYISLYELIIKKYTKILQSDHQMQLGEYIDSWTELKYSYEEILLTLENINNDQIFKITKIINVFKNSIIDFRKAAEIINSTSETLIED